MTTGTILPVNLNGICSFAGWVVFWTVHTELSQTGSPLSGPLTLGMMMTDRVGLEVTTQSDAAGDELSTGRFKCPNEWLRLELIVMVD